MRVPGTSAPSKGTPSVFRNREFLLLWTGLLLSGVGDWINYVAMVAQVYQQTHSALALAGLRLFHIVPILVVAPFAGVFVDRWSRKRTLVISPLVALTFFNPARAAIIPNIVSEAELVPANSLAQITATASIVAGGVVGGLIVSQVGTSAAFAIDAISFLLVALLVALIRVRESGLRRSAGSIESEIMEGVRYLRHEPVVGNVVVAGAIFVFAPATVLTLGIAFVQSALHAGSAGYGQILGGLGVGSVLGAALMIWRRPSMRQDLIFALSGIALGAAVAGLGLSPSVLIAAIVYGVAGFASMVNTVSGVTLLQRLVPDAVRGRIFAVSSTFDHLGAFASTIGIGAGSGILGPGRLITGSGVVAALTGGISLIVVARRAGLENHRP